MRERKNNISLKEINKILHKNTNFLFIPFREDLLFQPNPQGSARAQPWAVLFIRFAEKVGKKTNSNQLIGRRTTYFNFK